MLHGVPAENGFCIETNSPLSEPQLSMLHWLIAETFEPDLTQVRSKFTEGKIVEIGPRLSIETPYSSNAIGMSHSMGIPQVVRIERTNRYLSGSIHSDNEILKKHLDKMVQQHYPFGIQNFDTGVFPEIVGTIDLISGGKAALQQVNRDRGLGMEDSDMDYYCYLFTELAKRNPTEVELFQLGNMNSEHSRHGYWNALQEIDGVMMEKTLMQLVKEPLANLGSNNRSLVSFKDNAGVIRGFPTRVMLPIIPGRSSSFQLFDVIVHVSCTAETHNHPTLVAPRPGAETGGGGRLRDIEADGRGGIFGMGLAGYAVANLFMSGNEIPGEVTGKGKLSKYASALSILIEGSNGISSYGNQIGEPLTGGFSRSFEQMVDEEWYGYRKPILYTAGVGQIFDEHLQKEKAEVGMLIVRIGGPAYPIGVGGGAASSMMPGQNTEALDFNSVQRGNAEMENKNHRVIRACIEMRERNPISSIHDQGAGGPSNVLTELLEPLGGEIDIRKIVLGDKTMSVMEIWSAEFQEGFGLLIRPECIGLFQFICQNERVNCEVLGEITGSGKVVVKDSSNNTTPVDLNLEQILSKMPQKTFKSKRRKKNLKPAYIPTMSVGDAIEMVFKLPSVGSKGFLVHKADRSVTGLVAQQQCCGIAQIAIADASVVAQSHFGLTGSVAAIGEQPLKMLVNDPAGARMAVGEMVTNMTGVKIEGINSIMTRANWMWPAKMPHEGAGLYDAMVALVNILKDLGIGIDGGKDSLSMVANVGNEKVKSPGSLVMCGYARVPDITKKVTPDIKKAGKSLLGMIDLGFGKNRLGGSAFLQALNQIGDECPDVDFPHHLLNAFNAVQALIEENLILSLHDRSDGGLITTVAEMCMASQCGFQLNFDSGFNPFATLFNEELGFVFEYEEKNKERIGEICASVTVKIQKIGRTDKKDVCSVGNDATRYWQSNIKEVRRMWERTSYELEKQQTNEECAEKEFQSHSDTLFGSKMYRLSFVPGVTSPNIFDIGDNPRVAIIREEGTNGDREMAAACYAAGLEPVDVSMQHLLSGAITLKSFQGVIFAGGFSYMDVFGSAKGWAAGILFNEKLKKMFDEFYARPDTFSLGVCNGAQLALILGWVPFKDLAMEKRLRFMDNVSGKFESRWVNVEIQKSPSILLKGMEGSRLGIWVAHGEGQLIIPDDTIMNQVIDQNLWCMSYINSLGAPTAKYPYNPNGSPMGVTGLCSPDGRHLAMMPHPERSFLKWQWPWMPASWQDLEASPWLKMFQNARVWCIANKP
ncbi:MAG: phosphoribosylformylglycinamidine synthase [bacterium]